MNPPIHDITDPGEFLPGPPPLWQSWEFWLIVMVALSLVSFILFFILRKKAHAKPGQTLLEQARARLDKLKAESSILEPQTTAVSVSLIIRQYLEAVFKDPALFETNEEFTLRPNALEKLHPDCRQAVSKHLAALSELKYFPSAEHDHILDLINQAAHILTQIEQSVASPEPSPTA
jgi:Tfp pilus assembly protein PilN